MRYHFPKHAATSAIPEQWASFGEKGKLAPTPPNPYPNTAVHTSLVLTYPWGFLKKMSLFSHIFVLLPFPLYSEQQSENQCHRGPRLSLGKEIQNESPRVLARKQSEPDRVRTCSEPSRRFHANEIDIAIPGFPVYVGLKSEAWTPGKTENL